MIQALSVTIILFSMFLTVPQVDAGCTTTRAANYSSTTCSDGRSSFGVTSGGTTFHQFSDGSTSVTNSFGNIGFSSSNRSDLSGTNQSINENTGVSRWDNGVTGIHQNLGNMQIDSYSDGTTCTTAPVGPTSFTTCDGNDAAQRSMIIGPK